MSLMFTLLVGCSSVEKQNSDLTISFNQSDKLDFPFIGHGVQWSAYPHADADAYGR